MIFEYKGKAEANYNKSCYAILVIDPDNGDVFYAYNCYKDIKMIKVSIHTKNVDNRYLRVCPFSIYEFKRYSPESIPGIEFEKIDYDKPIPYFLYGVENNWKKIETIGVTRVQFEQFEGLKKLGIEWLPPKMKRVKKINYKKIPKEFHDFFEDEIRTSK